MHETHLLQSPAKKDEPDEQQEGSNRNNHPAGQQGKAERASRTCLCAFRQRSSQSPSFPAAADVDAVLGHAKPVPQQSNQIGHPAMSIARD